MAQPKTRIRFNVSVMAAILIVVLVMTLVTITMILSVSDRSANRTAETIFSTSASLARERAEGLFQTARDIAAAGSVVPGMHTPLDTFSVDHPALPYLRQVLRGTPVLYSVYAGLATGDFLQLIRVSSDTVASVHDAPAETAFILRSIAGTGDDRLQYWSFVSADGRVLGRRIDTPAGFDPRQRPWYLAAARASQTDGTDVGVPAADAVVTPPYLFNSLQELGVTASRAMPDGTGVFGVDVTLADLQRFVDEQRVSAGGGLAIVDSTGSVVAASQRIAPLLSAIDIADTPESLGRASDGDGNSWFLWSQGWTIAGDTPWRVVAAAPTTDFLGPFDRLRRQIILVAAILLAIMVPVLLVFTRSLTRVLNILVTDARQIRQMEFVSRPALNSRILEFHELAEGFGQMKEALAGRTRQLNANMNQLAKIIELNIAISAENDINRLSELILTGARELTNADAGSLYLKNEAGTELVFQIVLNETLGFAQGGTSGNEVTLPPVPLYREDGSPNDNNVVTHAFHTGETFNIADAYDAEQFDFSGTRHFDDANGYRSTSMLTVPLKPRGSGIIGAMQLINHVDPDTGEIAPFSAEIQRFVEALAAGAATALYNRDLIEAQKRLFDSMIRLIAGAIDAKSPYTGGHCARVPILAMMLGREAESVHDGPLAEFRFNSDQDWRAFRIGAWLHDAGKVTTPDYVVDKSTKLETIYNRIHEIRTRFEVILRDARIARHEAVLAGADAEDEDRKLAEVEAQLADDYEFVAECNLGGEFISEEHVARLDRIAARTWMRHFDDSLGISWEEANRISDRVARDLPVEEHLLADKPEHVVSRTSDFYDTYEGFGFTIPVPEALYNRGELYNLKVGRGTLTAEERFKINEHVMQTIVMLEDLPFPEELKRVPEYAGTHHEALNGSGYPRQLTGEDLSVPARIMAIADIFEALTASDRPYKRAKPLSVAVDILSKFRDEGHIDPDLFKLFLTSGAYRRYAEEYLKPEQLDDVDINAYL